jgi:DNA-binding transcriptional LysR family regulator
MIELLFEIVGEFLLQAVMEALAELGLHSLGEPFRRPRNRWLAGLGYAIFGALAGGLTLWLLPDHLVRSEVLRKLNLLVTPLASGGIMCLMGAWRARRGDELLRIDRFAYGYVFALSLALVRYIFAQ